MSTLSFSSSPSGTDPPALYDMNLLNVEADQLVGSWQLACTRSVSSPELPWAKATHVQVDNDRFELRAPGAAFAHGLWKLQRHTRLSQPYLVFDLPDATTQALVTRLQCSPDGALRHLTLYFQSGMELRLTHP